MWKARIPGLFNRFIKTWIIGRVSPNGISVRYNREMTTSVEFHLPKIESDLQGFATLVNLAEQIGNLEYTPITLNMAEASWAICSSKSRKYVCAVGRGALSSQPPFKLDLVCEHPDPCEKYFSEEQLSKLLRAGKENGCMGHHHSVSTLRAQRRPLFWRLYSAAIREQSHA